MLKTPLTVEVKYADGKATQVLMGTRKTPTMSLPLDATVFEVRVGRCGIPTNPATTRYQCGTPTYKSPAKKMELNRQDPAAALTLAIDGAHPCWHESVGGHRAGGAP